MATRMIVTSQPDVACDVCERRLLRGEQPDVFLAGGRRRTVCELCAPRATHEGWLRETDHHSLNLPPARPRRGRNLLDRLRQQRAPVEPPAEIVPAEDSHGAASYDYYDGGPGATASPTPGGVEETARTMPAAPSSAAPAHEATPMSAVAPLTRGEAETVRALEVFNAGEHPRRVAGVARSLGAPSVTVRPLAESGSTVVAIVVAWELSWYRYEVDLGDEAAGANVTAQGTELSELAAEDCLGNAAADANGALSLVGSTVQ